MAMQAPRETESCFRGRDGFAFEPDYKIEEIFDPEDMSIYFMILRTKPSTGLATDRKFTDLGEAKACVKMLRKYRNRVFHDIEG